MLKYNKIYLKGDYIMSNETPTKLCKYCQTPIPKKAKVCPNCRKKQGGKLKWIVIAVVVLFIIGIATSGGGDNKDTSPKKVENVSTNDKATQENTEAVQAETTAQEQEPSNIFNVGDAVETEDLRITFLSSSSYVSDNQFLQPKDGYEYWEFEFKFENISDTDQTVSSMMDWECYADNSKVDQSWIGDDNGLDATLSSGRQTQGKIYFEVPKDAKSIELEYDINFWQDNKIVFVGK